MVPMELRRSTKNVSRVSVWYDGIFTDLSIGVKAKFINWSQGQSMASKTSLSNLVPRFSLLCLHCRFSTTMEAEKRHPGNEVGRSGEKNLEKRQPLKTFSLVERNEQKALLNITPIEQRDF